MKFDKLSFADPRLQYPGYQGSISCKFVDFIEGQLMEACE